MHYYNENDPDAVAWLRQLIAEGHIPEGYIDARSIRDVRAADLAGYVQCHFFAGIGGWPLALKFAGWPEDKPAWTGSCPCQPFSDAGLKLGAFDPRHLWPVWLPLIRECGPPVVFGEQVASKAALGWLDGVFADLEATHYACAAADMCAASVGAPHIRQRLFWVADAQGHGRNTGPVFHEVSQTRNAWTGDRGGTGRMEHPEGDGRQQRGAEPSGWSVAGGRGSRWMGEPIQPGLEGHAGNGDHGDQSGRIGAVQDRPASASGGAGYWDAYDILPCLDGKARRVEPGTFPLAHGLPARVGRLRGYGNAIVPQVAAHFIQAFLAAR